jgi:leucyl aminopeptidase (aminopeptidase T)
MDTFKGTYDRSLLRGARAAVEQVIAAKRKERVLIISNPGADTSPISSALFDAVLEAEAVPVLIYQREKGQFDFAEEEVIKGMASEPNVVLSVSKDRLGKDRWGMKNGYTGKRRYDHVFDQLYEEGKIRGFWSPGITEDMFRRTVPIDYNRLRKDCALVSKAIEGKDWVHVTAPGGTDVLLGVKGRKARKDDGDYRKPGLAGNVPSGEVYVSPALGTMEGTISFDGSMVLNEGEVVMKKPIVAEVHEGYISEISGGKDAELLEESIRTGERKARESGRKGQIKPDLVEKYARNAWSIGELGIGLNRKARIVANMLEDEKVYGTCHFAVGSNYDGDAEALIHLDGLVKAPTIVAISSSGKEQKIMENGRLAWD